MEQSVLGGEQASLIDGLRGSLFPLLGVGTNNLN